jgi:hypothetical protein
MNAHSDLFGSLGVGADDVDEVAGLDLPARSRPLWPLGAHQWAVAVETAQRRSGDGISR